MISFQADIIPFPGRKPCRLFMEGDNQKVRKFDII